MSFEEFYCQKFEKTVNDNVQLTQNPKTKNELKDLDDKIRNFYQRRYPCLIERFATEDIYTEYVLCKILDDKDPELTAQFMKEPGKQNLAEKCQHEYISNNLPFKVAKISQSGSNVLYLDKGGTLTSGTIPKNEGVKALDFFIKGKRYTYYFTAKRTAGAGGAQDNQRNDVLETLNRLAKNPNIRGGAILDGPYYQMMDKDYETPLQILQREYSEFPNIIIGTSDEVISKILELENEG